MLVCVVAFFGVCGRTLLVFAHVGGRDLDFGGRLFLLCSFLRW